MVQPTYKVDSQFNEDLSKFINDNKNWKIIFYPAKRDGSVCYFSSDENDTPAEIISLDNEKNKFVLENKDKYDICCG